MDFLEINSTEIISMVLSPLVSFIVMCITLIFQNKKSKQQLKQQKEQFETTLNNQKEEFEKSYDAQEKHYSENQKMMQEQHRLSIMPYLILEKIEINNRDGNAVFDISLKNIGNNIATSISVKCKKDSTIVKTYNLYEAKREYFYSDFLFDNILQINFSGNFGVTLLCSPIGITTNAISTFKNIGELEFTVTFFDIQMNKYSQSFFFQYNIANKKYPIGRQETYPPKLLITNQ